MLKDDLEKVGAELKSAKDRVAELQAKFDGLLNRYVRTTTPMPDEDEDMTSSEMLLQTITNEPGRDWNYEDLQKANPSIPLASLRALVYKLGQDGKIKNVGRGEWKAI